jgi:hypothetical protein
MSDTITKYFEMLESGEWVSNNTRENFKDQIVENVKTLYDIRAIKGKNRYGVTMERNDLSFVEWLIHLQEELMDATIYLEKLKFEYDATTKTK